MWPFIRKSPADGLGSGVNEVNEANAIADGFARACGFSKVDQAGGDSGLLGVTGMWTTIVYLGPAVLNLTSLNGQPLFRLQLGMNARVFGEVNYLGSGAIYYKTDCDCREQLD